MTEWVKIEISKELKEEIIDYFEPLSLVFGGESLRKQIDMGNYRLNSIIKLLFERYKGER